MTLKEAVGKVLEGWTLPNAVRKILEEAYFVEPEEIQDTLNYTVSVECKRCGSHEKYDLEIDNPQRTWVGMMRGIRVDGDTVVISVKGGNDAARELCAYLIDEMN